MTRGEPASSLTLIHPLISLVINGCPYAPKPCQSIIPLPQPLLLNHISTEGKILREDGPILVHDLIAGFKVLQGFPGPLICPDVSGNFVFSPPNIPSSHSVLPVAPSIPSLCLGSVSTLLPLKQNPHLGPKQQTFMSQSQPKSFQGIIGLTLSQFRLLRCHSHQPQPVHVSYLKRRRHENRHVLWGYCLPSIRIFIKMWIQSPILLLNRPQRQIIILYAFHHCV